jgi:hypothetical protein
MPAEEPALSLSKGPMQLAGAVTNSPATSEHSMPQTRFPTPALVPKKNRLRHRRRTLTHVKKSLVSQPPRNPPAKLAESSEPHLDYKMGFLCPELHF